MYNFHVIAKGYDDRTGIPFPPPTLEGCKRLFVNIGKTENDAEYIWKQTQALKRKITTFQTLANKSINKQRRVTPKLRLQVLARDKFRCMLCGRGPEETVLHVDHITPVAKGGKNEKDYLATLCQECNLGKSVQTIDEIIKNN